MTIVGILTATAASLAVATATTALAQDASAPLLSYVNTQEHKAALIASLRPYYALLPSCHPESAKRVGLLVLAPVSFGASNALSTGAWKEGVQVDGCGTSGLFNVLTMARPSGPPIVGALLPGTTYADMELQRDALPTVRAVASAKMSGGCGDLHVIDTTFDGYGEVVNADVPAGREPRMWHETWTVAGCGRQTTATVRFVPDHTGTSFTAAP